MHQDARPPPVQAVVVEDEGDGMDKEVVLNLLRPGNTTADPIILQRGAWLAPCRLRVMRWWPSRCCHRCACLLARP
jgi:hypothetical protein